MPIAFHEGNKYEGHTMLPTINKFVSKYGLENFVVVADSGLMNNANIAELEAHGYKYIIGAKIKNESQEVKNWILEQPKQDCHMVEYDKGGGRRLLIGYTGDRAKKDAYNREKGIRRMEKAYKHGALTKGNINKRDICICFVALKVYKELERMLKVSEIKMSVDKVLALAKTITTIQIKLPLNKEVAVPNFLGSPAKVCGYSINYFICKPQFQHLYNIFYKRYKDNVNISIYRHLQKCVYKGLCPKLSTNFRLRNLKKNYIQSVLFIRCHRIKIANFILYH